MPRPYKKQSRRGKSADAGDDAPEVTDASPDVQVQNQPAQADEQVNDKEPNAPAAAEAPAAAVPSVTLATPSKAPHMSASLASPCIPPTPPPTPATAARPPPPPVHGIGTTTFGDDEAGEQPRRPSVDGDTIGMVNPRLAQAGDPMRSPTAEAHHHHDHYVPDPPTNEPVVLGDSSATAESTGSNAGKHVTISPMAENAGTAAAEATEVAPNQDGDGNSRLAAAGDPLRSPKGEAHHHHDHYVPDPEPTAVPVVPGEQQTSEATQQQNDASKSGSSKHVTISPIAHDAQTPMVPMRSANKSPAPAILKNGSSDLEVPRRWRDGRAGAANDPDGDAAAVAAPHRIAAKPARGATQWAVDVGVVVAIAAFISRCT